VLVAGTPAGVADCRGHILLTGLRFIFFPAEATPCIGEGEIASYKYSAFLFVINITLLNLVNFAGQVSKL